MAEYVDFRYLPLEGKITGKQVLKQTEDAINDLGRHVYEIDIDNELIQEAIDTSDQAIDTAEAALSAVTTNRAMWFNTVAEMKATDIALGITAATRGKGVFNDGDGAFYAVREIKGGDVDSDDTVFLDNGNVAERIKQFNLVAKGNNIIYVANVANLRASDAVAGLVYGTTGYYAPNDGGAGLYNIRTATQTDTDNGGSIIILDNGNVAELITDGKLNVRQFGAKGDGSTDDTVAFQNMFATDSLVYYIPSGNYLVGKRLLNWTSSNALSHNVEIYGDGAEVSRLKLKDNEITADNQMLMWIKPKEGSFIDICVHDFYIDMNRTHNHQVIDDSDPYDAYALQHCHAIAISTHGTNPVPKQINVLAYNLSFNDLIADGLGLSGSGVTEAFDTVMVHNITSKNRQGTRSDVCFSADFNNAIVSDCDLDRFETEINKFCDSVNHNLMVNNVVTRRWFDLNATYNIRGSSTTKAVYKLNNCICRGFVNFGEAYYFLNDCHIELSQPLRCHNAIVEIRGGSFRVLDNYNPVSGGTTYEAYINLVQKEYSAIRFYNCDLEYDTTNYRFISKNSPGQSPYNANPEIYNLVLSGCRINSLGTPTDILNRAGNVLIENCDIYKNGGSLINIYSSLYSNVESVLNNNVLHGTGAIMQPANNSTAYINTIYSYNNKTDTFGLVLSWVDYTKITASRGGSGTNVECVKLDDYQGDAIPTTGKWVKGQTIYNSNPDAGTLVRGWVCTTSGDVGSAVFTSF